MLSLRVTSPQHKRSLIVSPLTGHDLPSLGSCVDEFMLSAVTPGNDAHREHHVGDTGRQGPLDAARAAIVPDSMKSDSQVAKDHTRGKATISARTFSLKEPNPQVKISSIVSSLLLSSLINWPAY